MTMHESGSAENHTPYENQFSNVFDTEQSLLDLESLRAVMTNAEQMAREILRTAEGANEECYLPRAPIETINAMMGMEQGEQQVEAFYTGLLYDKQYPETDDDDDELEGRVAGPGVFLTDMKVDFMGATYVDTDDGERIMFEMVRDDDRSQSYFAPLESMLQLELQRDSAAMMVERFRQMARELLATEFYWYDREDQVGAMQSVATACYEALQKCIGSKVVTVYCQRYFERQNIPNSKKFEADRHDDDDAEVRGRVVGVEYLDVLQTEGSDKPFQSAEDLPYGGVPYLMVRDEQSQITRYVPIDVVDAIG